MMPNYMPDCTCGYGGLQSNCATIGLPHKGACDTCGWNRVVHKKRVELLRKEGLTPGEKWPHYRRLVLKTTEAT